MEQFHGAFFQLSSICVIRLVSSFLRNHVTEWSLSKYNKIKACRECISPYSTLFSNYSLLGFPSKFSLNEIHSFLFKTFVNFDVFSLKFSTSFSRKFRPFLRNFRSIKFNFKNERKFSFSFTLRCLNEIFAKEIERKFGNPTY